MDKIVSLCRRRGFVFQSSEIYGGLGSAYDYGHYGVLTKNNIKARWWEAMIQEREDIVALDSAIILNPRVWEASGHVPGVTDPLVDCQTCKPRVRTSEFGRMELEFCVPPLEADEWFAYWIEQRHAWYVRYGLRESHLRVRPHEADELAHYARAASDIEYLFPIGWSELEGIANRGTFDLTQHTENSGTKLEYVGEGGERYTPHVIEPAGGPDRTFLALLVDAYDEEVVAERDRTVLRLHPAIAPVKAAILPLIPRNGDMVEKARGLYDQLRTRHVVEYDDGGQIGRRYRRQDEIGTPFAFTIDDQTLEDDTVTVRDRDSLAQERLPIGGVPAWLEEALTKRWRTPVA